jgi:PAS domain S-box-containing protein
MKAACRVRSWGLIVITALSAGTTLLNSSTLRSQTLDKERTHIIVGTELAYPPYSFLDEKSNPTGFNVDLTRSIAGVMGMTNVDVQIGPWGDIRKALETGHIDAISGMYYSEERDKLVDFSPPYAIVHHAIFARRDTPDIRSENELRGKDIIVMQRDIMHDYVLEHGITRHPVLVDDQAQALRLLASGKHDYALIAQLPGLYWIKKLHLRNLRIAGPLLLPLQYCYAVKDGDAELLAHLSEGLAITKKNNEYSALYNKWLGVLEPRGVPARTIIKYAAIVLIPLVIILMGSILWSHILRKEVARRTEALEKEIAVRTRTEETLDAERKRLSITLHCIGDGVIATDIEGKVMLMSRVSEQLTGWPVEKAIGKPLGEVFHIINAETRKPCDNPAEKVLKNGTAVALADHTVLIARDGRERNIANSGTSIRDEEGTILGVILVFRDITEQKKAIDALRKSEQRYRSYIDLTDQLAWITNEKGEVEKDIPAWRKFTGQSEEEVKGWGWMRALHPDDVKRTDKIWQESVEKQKGYETEYRVCKWDGTYRYFLARGVPVRKDNGAVYEWVGTCIDITERKRSEEQLRRSQKLEALGKLAGSLAHEFNNILAGIMGYTSLLKTALPPKTSLIADLEAIEKLSHRAAGLTKSILAFARKGPYLPEPLSINRIVEDVLKIIGQTMGKTITITAKLSPDVSNVLGDEGQLSQVIMNLCVNACEAMPEGGTLTLETKDTYVGGNFFIIHSDLKKQPYVSVTVSDTGTGIENELLDHLFEPFFTTKKQKTKTGLGLAMVSGIVEKHGGCVEVESEPGNGSTFTVYLPATKDKERIVPPKPIKSLMGNETVLVVDDEDAFRESIRRMLEALGYTVLKASGGKEALKILSDNKEKVNLVLLDMIMKEMDGAETFKKMRKLVPHLKVIICSGFSLDSKCQMILNGGGKGFLQKPFRDTELASKIREVIDGH